MEIYRIARLTLIAEAVLERRLLDLLRDGGARGWTISEARGEGTRGIRASDWEGRNVRIETLIPEALAERLLAEIAERFFAEFAIVAFIDEVRVARGSKYG